MPFYGHYYPQGGRKQMRDDMLLALLQSQSGNSTPQQAANAPTFTPNGGEFGGSQLVSLASTTLNASIYYTVDGSDPVIGNINTASYDATGPFFVTATSVIHAIAVAPGYSQSAISSAAFTILVEQVATPIVNIPAGTYTETIYINASCFNADVIGGKPDIRYTINGIEVNAGDPQFPQNLKIDSTTVLRLRGYAVGKTPSEELALTYYINETPQVATPVEDPANGTLIPAGSTIDISASTATAGAIIYYESLATAVPGDVPTPTQASPVYLSPIPISVTTTFKFKAYKSGLTPSTTRTATYTLTPTDMDGWWGSAGPVFPAAEDPTFYLQEIDWPTYFTAWNRTLADLSTIPFSMDFNAPPTDPGAYRFYICQQTAPPLLSGTLSGFTMTTGDLAGVDQSYPHTDNNGWPCYIPLPAADGYPYRIYRIKNRAGGAFNWTIIHDVA